MYIKTCESLFLKQVEINMYEVTWHNLMLKTCSNKYVLGKIAKPKAKQT